MKEAFIEKEFRESSLEMIEQANAIIEEYIDQGFQLTLRQLYYQFVARGLLENTVRNYKKLGALLSDAHLAGLIDWAAIEDRTRNLATLSHWSSPEEIISSARESYRIDRWENQPNYIEVWIEKEALTGVIKRICDTLDIPFFACRGYVSQSEQYAAGKRLQEISDKRTVWISHLGDHDPSGLDMTRDNWERLNMFTRSTVRFARIALNMDQIQQYNPPPNPAKTTDSRYHTYIRQFGEESWELDALDPTVLEALIRTHVEQLTDWDQRRVLVNREVKDRTLLNQIEKRWAEIVKFLETGKKGAP